MATKVGGNFITIDGEAEIEVYDKDQIYTESDMNITAYYRNILL